MGQDVEETLSALLPEGVAVAVSREAVADLALDDEIAITEFMSDRRRVEFLAGRSCVRRALRRLDVPDAPLLVGRTGAPRWPPGIVGSISHGAGCYVASAARESTVSSLGIDVEREGRVAAHLDRYVMHPEERVERRAVDDDWRTCLFSIKEAVYKAVRSQTGVRPGFLDVSVALRGRARYEATVRLGDAVVMAVPGAWMRRHGLVFSVAYLEAVRQTGR